jgi:hypothetical protein
MTVEWRRRTRGQQRVHLFVEGKGACYASALPGSAFIACELTPRGAPYGDVCAICEDVAATMQPRKESVT